MQKVLEPGAELLRKCAEGNRAAFNEIFRMYRSYAYNLIYKITGPRGDHEDLIQDVFFQVYLSLKAFKGDSSFKTWFHRLVIHACTRQWRYQNTEKRISPKNLVNIDSVEYALQSSEEMADRRVELKNMVEKALDKLELPLRIPLVLHIYSEMDLAEISVVLDIPEGTVKSRLFTARKKMKEFLDGVADQQ